MTANTPPYGRDNQLNQATEVPILAWRVTLAMAMNRPEHTLRQPGPVTEILSLYLYGSMDPAKTGGICCSTIGGVAGRGYTEMTRGLGKEWR